MKTILQYNPSEQSFSISLICLPYHVDLNALGAAITYFFIFWLYRHKYDTYCIYMYNIFFLLLYMFNLYLNEMAMWSVVWILIECDNECRTPVQVPARSIVTPYFPCYHSFFYSWFKFPHWCNWFSFWQFLNFLLSFQAFQARQKYFQSLLTLGTPNQFHPYDYYFIGATIVSGLPITFITERLCFGSNAVLFSRSR